MWRILVQHIFHECWTSLAASLNFRGSEQPRTWRFLTPFPHTLNIPGLCDGPLAVPVPFLVLGNDLPCSRGCQGLSSLNTWLVPAQTELNHQQIHGEIPSLFLSPEKL